MQTGVYQIINKVSCIFLTHKGKDYDGFNINHHKGYKIVSKLKL